MKSPLLLLLSALLVCAAQVSAADAPIPAQPLVSKGKQLLADDFARSELGGWRAVVPTFVVAEGVLKGSQTRDDHGAVGAVKAGFKDGVVEFRFRFDGATSINAVLDDKAFKGSHAGHLCRVTITPKLIRLGDDKEGGMRNDIFALMKDPARKAERDKLLIGRTRTFPMSFEPQKWYHMSVEIAGDEMRVSIDGKPAGYLQSPGLAHENKSDFHFTVNGKDALFDDVAIYAAAPKQP